MEPKWDIRREPEYYFSNRDYTDYRELVCFERPTCFVLHFYFGITTTRLWLYDRFAFKFHKGQLISECNALADHLRSEGISSEVSLLHPEDFSTLATKELSKRNALIAPISKKIGSSMVVTSLLLERIKNEVVECSSLRGDDFYISKPVDVKSIQNQLYVEDFGVKFQRVTIREDIFKKHISATTDWTSFKLADKFDSCLYSYYKKEQNSGHAHLSNFLKFHNYGYEHYSKKVSEGFLNVLLAEYFWPMLFAYSPYLVFLRYAFSHNVSLCCDSTRDEVLNLLQKINLQAELVTNLGNMFGLAPTDKVYQRFYKAMSVIVDLYGQVEESVAHGTRGSM